MANPTTNFGWVMPTSSSLVTNLPADFNTFGQAVDTSMAQLKGGTTGQILSKTSATDMAFTWITNDVGDITAVTAGTGISGGGTSGAVTITNDMATTMTASGDIVVGTGSGTYDNLPIGTTGQVLTADTTVSPYKVKWATAGGGGKVLQVVSATTSTSVTIASTTMTDSGITATITPTSATSRIYVIISVSVTFGSSSVDVYVNGALKRGATTVLDMTGSNFLASDNGVYRRDMNSVTYVDSPATTSATTYKFQGAVSQTASSRQVIFQPASGTSVITLLEIGA